MIVSHETHTVINLKLFCNIYIYMYIYIYTGYLKKI